MQFKILKVYSDTNATIRKKIIKLANLGIMSFARTTKRKRKRNIEKKCKNRTRIT